jgi:hypothetical protein
MGTIGWLKLPVGNRARCNAIARKSRELQSAPVRNWRVSRSIMNTFNPGDRVALSEKFLRSIGRLTDGVQFARGTVQAVENLFLGASMVSVDWDDGLWPVNRVLDCNLTLATSVATAAVGADFARAA